jgi:cell division septation protein DedD
VKERLIGACVLVALAVIFIPMLFHGPEPGATVTSSVTLPGSSSQTRTFEMSLTRNAPPRPISPRVAAGKAAPAGRIDRPQKGRAPREKTLRQGREIKVTPAPAPARPKAAEKQPPESASRSVALNLDLSTSEQGTQKTVPAETEAPDHGQPVDTRPQPAGWFVQAGSFAHKKNASRLTSQLKGKGFSAFVATAESGGHQVYRVRVGPLGERRDAEKLAPSVAAATGAPTEVVSNP